MPSIANRMRGSLAKCWALLLVALAAPSAGAGAQQIAFAPTMLPQDVAVFGGGGPALAYSPVLLITGDSQAAGTLSTTDQNAAVAAYVPTSKIKVRNIAGAFVTYTPGTITGVDFGANTGKVGTEIGFIALFRAAFPNDTLYIIKEAASGSYQTRGLNAATAANLTSAGGNTYTLNSGSILNGANTLITGTGIETGVYVPFAGFLSKVGVAGGRSAPAFGPVDLSGQYNGTLSWSSTEGLTYNGNSASITNGARARIVAGMALLTTPKIVAHVHNIGTNDIALATAAAFATDLDNIYARFTADIPGYATDAKTILVRSPTGGASSTTVRDAQLAKRDQVKIFLLDTDSYTRWDGTHWNLVAHTDMGNKAFGIWQGTFSGV
ncbi:hypothetical protein I3J27_21500 [Bradyrhizobium xenonodulans]|uniref:Uncharacterized protein n=1 Tax=Bradyrhizobium xenonodulans TaxID=2736875 RepID=A0ABY7MDI8_9BRAD|nr:hypothetical protein [Bradyrhizobium xenonodulans]WBL75611.1 hypothetical protein I3J27_21500 [Bradyrhizobium xenonodulans]